MTEQLWKPNKVINLADSVEYAEGSIVSKILFDKTNGSLTLFAISKGQGIAEHKSPYDATVQVIDGFGLFNIAGEKHIAKSGEALIMPADVPHAVEAGKDFKML